MPAHRTQPHLTHFPGPTRVVSRPLQRNQACATCRSRKVRCDAKKPACGACCRSAAAHGEDPNIVLCHYDTEDDDEADHGPDQSQPRKMSVRIAGLEDKIAEVEKLIAELDIQPGPSPSFALPLPDHSALLSHHWPTSLPPRPIVSHLVHLYLSQPSGAGQVMFTDPPAFQAALHLPPLDPSFPFVGLIHAILAHALQRLCLDPDHFLGSTRYWPPGQSVHAYHADCAKIKIEEAIGANAYLFQALQALSIFSAYAYDSGRLVEAWVYSGLGVRFVSPLGINLLEHCEAYDTGEKPKPRTLLTPPRSAMEKYHRAVTFWYTFQQDRFLAVASGRPHAIEESDVSSLLPIKPTALQFSTSPLSSHPLSLSQPHFFSVHPPDADELQLELKATILLGRVADWLRRSPDPVGFNLKKNWCLPTSRPLPDLRSQPDFIKLDQQLLTFSLSIPRQMLNLHETGPLVTSRLLIRLLPSLATILLYECFVTTGGINDLAMERCLGAARAILDLAYLVLGSSLDFKRLAPFTNFCWAVAARMLTRSLVLRGGGEGECGEEEVDVLKSAIDAQAPYSELAKSYAGAVKRGLEERVRLYGAVVRLVLVEVEGGW